MTHLDEPPSTGSIDEIEFSDRALNARIEFARAKALSDLSGALSESETLVAIVPESHAARARVLALRGHTLLYANRFDEAIVALDQALSAAGTSGNGTEIGEVQLARVQALARLGRVTQAEEAARAAYEQLRIAGEVSGSGKAAANLGIVLRMQGRAEESLTWFARASELLTIPGSLGAIESNRAEALLDLDRFDDARAAFERARELLLSAGMDHAAAIAEGNLADLHSRMGRIEPAVALFESARSRFERAGAVADAARLLAEHADALLSAGLARRSVRMYRESLTTLREKGLARESARAALGLGVALSAIDNDDAAVDALRDALEAARASGDALLESEAGASLGTALARTGALEPARSLLNEAIEKSKDRPARRALACCALAEIEPDDQDARAAESLRQAEHVADQTALTPLRVRIEHARGRRLLRAGDAQGADAHLQRALNHVLGTTRTMRRTRLRAASVQGAGRLFSDALSAAVRLGESGAGSTRSLHRVFDLLEVWRTSAFQAGCESLDGGTSLDRQDASGHDPELAEVFARLSVLYNRLGPTARAPIDPEKIREQLLTLEEQAQRRLDVLEGDRPRGSEDASLEGAMAALPPGVCAATYFECDGRIGAIALTSEHARLLPSLMSVVDARSLVRRVRLAVDFTLAGVRRDSGWDAIDEIRRTLLAPVVEPLGSIRTLRLNPGPLLASLPLCASAGRAGLDATLIPSMGSALAIDRARAGVSGDQGRMLVVGVADEHATAMETEARRVALSAPGWQLLAGAQAHASRVLDALPGASLVHLACHGIFDADFPLSSRLLLADRWVTARELAPAWRPGATVVLAGCDTAGSPGTHGDSAAGIARAALSSGAGCVIASQWALHDEVASEFFDLLHRRLSRPRPAQSGTAGFAGETARAVQDDLSHAGYAWPLWSGVSVLGGVA